jgi:hypothetical protein
MAFNIKIPFVIASHVLRRSGATYAPSGKSKASPLFVDTNDSNRLKYVPAGSGTTQATLVTTAAGQTQTGPVLVTPSGVVVAQEALFTQVAGNKVHTAAFSIPAGATILDVLVTNVTVWNSDTSAVLKAGLTDDDCFFAAMRLDSGVMAAGLTANMVWTAAFQGAAVPAIDGGGANDARGVTNGFLYNAAAVTLNAIVTDTNVTGTDGRTRVTVLYSLPSSVIAPTVV